jgi:hypothetical protein
VAGLLPPCWHPSPNSCTTPPGLQSTTFVHFKEGQPPDRTVLRYTGKRSWYDPICIIIKQQLEPTNLELIRGMVLSDFFFLSLFSELTAELLAV